MTIFMFKIMAVCCNMHNHAPKNRIKSKIEMDGYDVCLHIVITMLREDVPE